MFPLISPEAISSKISLEIISQRHVRLLWAQVSQLQLSGLPVSAHVAAKL